MSIVEALILGAVQGITEFLPVSSSGHLVLLQKIFHIDEPGILFDVMLHVGTLFAVFAVLRKDILRLLQKPFQRLTAFLIIATIPIVVIAILARDIIENLFKTGEYLGFAFLFTAFLLFISDKISKHTRRSKNEYNTTLFDVLIIGILQAVAIIPGVSRSGSTLSGALSRRLDRDFAARFIFLLSIPAVLGALVLELRKLVNGGYQHEIDIFPYIAGTLTSAVVGFFSVKFMIAIVRKHSLWGFALYVTVLGLLILIDQNITRFFF